MGTKWKGNCPTITRGPYFGDLASVDYIIYRDIASELDEKLFNLEFMRGRMNWKKSDEVGGRQSTFTYRPRRNFYGRQVETLEALGRG